MKRISVITGLLLLIFFSDSFPQFSNFITRMNDKLYDGEKEFRFISFNVPNLHMIEDNVAFTSENQWLLPDEFEIRDALRAIRQMNGKVARIYVLTVRRSDDPIEYIRHVEAPGKFNEEAFIALDKMMEIARQEGVRVIIPFIDNWWWMGGIAEYAYFRGKGKNEFWSDPQIINDFKKTIEFTVNRVNTFTGIPYRDDKTILAWETGNELETDYKWTAEIARYIKSIDRNHLVIDGSRKIYDEIINNDDVDIVTTHHYSSGPRSVEIINESAKRTKNIKPYFVGEFGFMPLDEIKMVLDTVINNGIVGALGWSLRFRNREGGFYYHTEPDRNNQPYRWPGFVSGDFFDEKNILKLFTEKAHQIDGKIPTPIPVPDSPFLLPASNPFELSWQGSAGADSYIIERRNHPDTNWSVIADNISDAEIAHRPLFEDESVEIGRTYQYRVFAKNNAGVSGASNISAPIKVNFLKLNDEFADKNKFYNAVGNIRLLKMEDIRKAKEDKSRLKGDDGDYIVYKVDGKLDLILLDIFIENNFAEVNILGGKNENDFVELPFIKETYKNLKNDYGFYTGQRYICYDFPEDVRFVKLILADDVQLSRLEINYNTVE